MSSAKGSQVKQSFIVVLLIAVLLAAAGCSQSDDVRSDPRADEIRMEEIRKQAEEQPHVHDNWRYNPDGGPDGKGGMEFIEGQP
jgi:hypothetical protein